jgi:hypothetical protein
MIQVGVGALVGFALGAALVAPKKKDPVSPLTGVSKQAWSAFCRRMACSPTGLKAPSGKLGAFAFSPRRLVDLGIASNATRENNAWKASFRPPFSEVSFLKLPRVQYAAFVKSNRRYFPKAVSKRGLSVDGNLVTVSGALAILHLAGEAGFDSWLSDSKVRKRFSNTTEAFISCNGVF